MDRKVLVDAVKALLLRVKSATPERATDVLKSLPGRNGYVPRLKLWLDENQSAFPEPFAVEDLDSLHDPGVDVLMTGARSGARIGFQVKSANDLRQKDFTPHLKSQILDAQGIQVDLFVVVFACPPTPANLTKIKYWQNKYLDRVDILCLSPEKAAGLHEVFDRPIQPIILTERTWPDFFRVTGQSHLASRYLVLLCHNFILFLHARTKGNVAGKSPEDAFDAISSWLLKPDCGAQDACDPRDRKSLGRRAGRRKATGAGGESRARSAVRKA